MATDPNFTGAPPPKARDPKQVAAAGGSGIVNALNSNPSPDVGITKNNGFDYGYQTNFTGAANPYLYTPVKQYGYGTTGAGANSADPDVRRAQALTNELAAATAGKDQGTDQGAVAAQIKALQARIGLRNNLGQAIAQNPNEEGQAVQNQRDIANQALSAGIKNTRQNYNSRGMLYSGLREGGEQGIKGKVGANLASNIAGTKRDYENTMASEKSAYTSLGFAQQQADLDRANEAFQVTTKNNIARAQAYEQLGAGVGGLAGAAYSYNNRPQTTHATEGQPLYSSGSPTQYGPGKQYAVPSY